MLEGFAEVLLDGVDVECWPIANNHLVLLFLNFPIFFCQILVLNHRLGAHFSELKTLSLEDEERF